MMCKLIYLFALLSLITYGKGELKLTKIKDNKETPILTTKVKVKSGDSFVLVCEVTALERNNTVDNQVAWNRFQSKKSLKKQANKELYERRILTPNEPFKLNFNHVTLDNHGTYICKGAEESKTIHLIVTNSYLDDKKKRDLYYYDVGDNKNSSSSKNIDDSILMELLNSLDKQGKESTTSKMYEDNINWNDLKEINNWPTNPQWSPPDPKWDIYLPTNNFSMDDIFNNKPSLQLEDLELPSDTKFEYHSTFKHYYYTVPLSIILILTGVIRLCYLIGRKTDSGWERLSATNTTCSHRICVRRRNANPSARCLLEGRDPSRLSVLIIHRFTAIGTANRDNNEAPQADAPPSYDDSTRNVTDNPNSDVQNELPPSYNEVLANMSSNNSTNLRETTAPSIPADVLPAPHNANTQ